METGFTCHRAWHALCVLVAWLVGICVMGAIDWHSQGTTKTQERRAASDPSISRGLRWPFEFDLVFGQDINMLCGIASALQNEKSAAKKHRMADAVAESAQSLCDSLLVAQSRSSVSGSDP